MKTIEAMVEMAENADVGELKEWLQLVAKIKLPYGDTPVRPSKWFKDAYPYGYRKASKWGEVYISSIDYNMGGGVQIFTMVSSEIVAEELVSPSVRKMVQGEVNLAGLSKLVKQYKMGPQDCLWVSTRGGMFAGNKKISKPSKVLRALYPSISESETEAIVEDLYYKSLDLAESIGVASVREVYLSPKLRIKSCMTKKSTAESLNIYDKIGANCVHIVGKKGNIIARTICYEGKHYSRVYAHTPRLETEFTKTLQRMGYTEVPHGYKTRSVELKFGEPLPYMDNVNYIHRDGDQIFFSSKSGDECFGIASSTGGGYSRY